MAHRVAAQWVAHLAHAEYRFDVLYGATEIRNLPNLLRSFRDGKVGMEGIPHCPDLGIQESGDSLTLWSPNREAMIGLKDWFEKKGFETTGLW